MVGLVFWSRGIARPGGSGVRFIRQDLRFGLMLGLARVCLRASQGVEVGPGYNQAYN